MTAFTVWKFDTPEGAGHAASQLEHVASEGMIKILDHAVVTWPTGAKRPETKHSHDSVKRRRQGRPVGSALRRAVRRPVIGVAAGAAIGGLAKATEGVGITKEQLETIRSEVTEGTWASSW